MKVPRELIGRSASETSRLLELRGWSRFGSGFYAEVFVNAAHPGVALKLARFAERSDGWMAYGTDCLKRRLRSRHSLKVFDVVPVDAVEGENFYLATMEALEPLCRSRDRDMWEALSWKVKSDSGATSDSIRDSIRDRALANFVQRLGRRYADRYDFDLHAGNMMRRPGTGEYVVTDPISHPAEAA